MPLLEHQARGFRVPVYSATSSVILSILVLPDA